MYRSIYDEKRKQWQGLETRPLYNPEITLGEALLKSMRVNGAKIAQVSFYSAIFYQFSALNFTMQK